MELACKIAGREVYGEGKETLESEGQMGGPEVKDQMRRVPDSLRGAQMRGSRRRLHTLPVPQFYGQCTDVPFHRFNSKQRSQRQNAGIITLELCQ